MQLSSEKGKHTKISCTPTGSSWINYTLFNKGYSQEKAISLFFLLEHWQLIAYCVKTSCSSYVCLFACYAQVLFDRTVIVKLILCDQCAWHLILPFFPLFFFRIYKQAADLSPVQHSGFLENWPYQSEDWNAFCLCSPLICHPFRGTQ